MNGDWGGVGIIDSSIVYNMIGDNFCWLLKGLYIEGIAYSVHNLNYRWKKGHWLNKAFSLMGDQESYPRLLLNQSWIKHGLWYLVDWKGLLGVNPFFWRHRRLATLPEKNLVCSSAGTPQCLLLPDGHVAKSMFNDKGKYWDAGSNVRKDVWVTFDAKTNSIPWWVFFPEHKTCTEREACKLCPVVWVQLEHYTSHPQMFIWWHQHWVIHFTLHSNLLNGDKSLSSMQGFYTWLTPGVVIMMM